MSNSSAKSLLRDSQGEDHRYWLSAVAVYASSA